MPPLENTPANSIAGQLASRSVLALCLMVAASLLVTKTTNLHAAKPTKTKNQRCGYAPLAALKYTKTHTHFDYVNKDAPKGGTIRIGRTGHFNSLNFLRYPGRTITDRAQMPLQITEYLFDSLLVKSADEAAAWYCLAAASVSVSKDLQKATFTLNRKARFHDGTPLTFKDVIFTFNTLKTQGPPYYRQTLRSITLKQNSNGSFTYSNSRKGDRNFISLVGSLPIHPAHFWDKEKLTERAMTLPLGSGPYKITSTDNGKSVTLTRVKSDWAKTHFTRQGRYNFDEIIIDYFRDENSALQSFKVGNQDFRQEFNTVTWSREYTSKALEEKRMIKESVAQQGAGELRLLTFNQRRPIFKNRKVRKALTLLYDFESANRILFHGLYEKATNIYGNTKLAAIGPATDEEEKLLAPFKATLPEGILKAPAPRFITQALTTRERFRQANRLLDEAGLRLEGANRLDPATGKPLHLSVAYLNLRHQRLLLHFAKNLKQVGITLDMPALEPASARKKTLDHDFDLAILKWQPAMLAGTSESLLWGSRLADIKGSYALAGIKDKALDATINTINKARNFKEMTIATKAFDRLFNWQINAIPLYRSNQQWVSYWSRFKRPEKGISYSLTLIDRMWEKPNQQTRATK